MYFKKKIVKIAGGLLLVLAVVVPLSSCWAEDKNAAAVDFSVETDDGQLSIEALRGDVVYIDFWASWCAPCRQSFPWMNEMHHRYKDQGLTILAIGIDKTRDLSDQFLASLPADFLIGFDHQGKLAEQFKLIGMPTAYLLDRNGVLVKEHVGFRKSKTRDYEASIRELLDQ